MDGYEALANAVVKQAILDYYHCSEITRDKTKPIADVADREMRRIERFFRSDYFDVLNFTKLTGSEIVKKLREYSVA